MSLFLVAFLIFILYSSYKADKKVEEVQKEKPGGLNNGNQQVFLTASAKKD